MPPSISHVTRGADNALQAAAWLSDEAQDLLDTASHLGVPNTHYLTQELAKIADPDKRTALLNEIAPALESHQAADVSAGLQKMGKPAPLDEDMAAQAGKKDGIDGELIADLTQMGLDLTGIFDPTPISDGTNALISLFRGDLLGAGLSALSTVPYVGDAAKLGKLGKWAETVAKSIDAAKSNPAVWAQLRPAMDTLQATLDKLPLDKLPESMRKPLQDIKNQVDEFGTIGKGIDFGNIPSQHHARYERYLNRVAAEGKEPLPPDAWMKKAETIWANNRAGNSFESTVRTELTLPVGRGSKPISIDGYIPDFPVGDEWGITDIKNVRNLTNSPQLDAFYKYAKDNNLTFNIVTGPNTKTISAPLIEKVRDTGGAYKN